MIPDPPGPRLFNFEQFNSFLRLWFMPGEPPARRVHVHELRPSRG